MLQNEYLVAKIGVDTAENEPSKVSGGSEFHPAVSHTDPTVRRTAAGQCNPRADGLAAHAADLKAEGAEAIGPKRHEAERRCHRQTVTIT